MNAEQAIIACRLLVAAYDRAINRHGSVDWADVDEACEAAREALDPKSEKPSS